MPRRRVAALLLLPCLAAPVPARAVLDVECTEVDRLLQVAREGTYPDGRAALSARTITCNVGDVPVPWEGPMAETHPFVGLSLYRLEDGTLEMIGTSWIKHAFFVTADDCGPGCPGVPGIVLQPECSDTYTATNNASQYYLGPRDEVNPFTASWEACGSFFDEPDGPDADCDRDWNGVGADPLDQRLTVADADLARPGATFLLEGQYVIADDVDHENQIAWREVEPIWIGSTWTFQSPLSDDLHLGPVAESWGDVSARVAAGPDDGELVLSMRAVDLGAGTWRYEYALFNWRSHRQAAALSIPLGGAMSSAATFHDGDADAGNDWTVANEPDAVTWSTAARPLVFQSLFTFTFEADAPPGDATARVDLFRPGSPASVMIPTRGPQAPATSVPEPGRLALACAPNPFVNGANVRFALPAAGPARVTVLDVTGRVVGLLLDTPRATAGEHRVTWPGRDPQGRPAGAGIYFFRLETATGTRTVKGMLLR